MNGSQPTAPPHLEGMVPAGPALAQKKRTCGSSANTCGANLTSQSSAAQLGLTCLAVVLALSGCSSMQVRMGAKVELDKTPVASIQASLPNGPAIAPGQKSPLVVTMTQPDGKALRTEGKGGGKVMWKDLQVTSTVVEVDKKGEVSVGRDPRISDGKVGHITVTVPSHADLRADLDVPFRYNVIFVSNFSGRPGLSGFNGTDGISGVNGSMGSIDPNNPSPGGDGTNGSDGSNGQDGGPGGDAPPVQVFVTLGSWSSMHPLLEVSVSAPGEERLYLVDPQGGSLSVRADGGPGGSGGRGGRGGKGGMGGTGTPNGRNGNDGQDGRNGWDGSQGRGGSITVTYDPQAEPYIGVIHLSSRNGPPPVFDEEPVDPLW